MIIEKIAPAKLVGADYNPREIEPHQLEALKRSIDRWGFVEPVIVNKRTGLIVGGHQRTKAAIELAIEEVPVTYVDLDDDAEKALNIALNKIAGDWDEQKLSDLLADLEKGGQDLEDLGFESGEIDELLKDLEGESAQLEGDLDEIPEAPAEPITQPGDLWQLGEHRLLCGDSTNAEDVARLMGGAKADAVISDPPYGMNYTGCGDGVQPGMRAEQRREVVPVINDQEDFDPMPTVELFGNPKEVLLWGGDWFYEHLPAGGSLVVWDKRASIEADAIPGAPFEVLWSKQRRAREFIRHPWGGWNNKEKGDTERHHTTQKPIACMVYPIEKATKANDIIAEPFAGSGTTIIAAEQTGRKCYAMELSPAYCDVAVKRWEQATRRKAERIE
jgi:DNA modification methylase